MLKIASLLTICNNYKKLRYTWIAANNLAVFDKPRREHLEKLLTAFVTFFSCHGDSASVLHLYFKQFHRSGNNYLACSCQAAGEHFTFYWQLLSGQQIKRVLGSRSIVKSFNIYEWNLAHDWLQKIEEKRCFKCQKIVFRLTSGNRW